MSGYRNMSFDASVSGSPVVCVPPWDFLLLSLLLHTCKLIVREKIDRFMSVVQNLHIARTQHLFTNYGFAISDNIDNPCDKLTRYKLKVMQNSNFLFRVESSSSFGPKLEFKNIPNII